MNCIECGFNLNQNALFCMECGTKIESDSNEGSWSNINNTLAKIVAKENSAKEEFVMTDEYIESDMMNQLLAKNQHYYRAKFLKLLPEINRLRFNESTSAVDPFFGIRRIINLNFKIWQFNWMAALFGSFWFAYRKMYLQSFLLILIYEILFIGKNNFFSFLLSLVSCFFCGLIANYLYYLSVEGKIKNSENNDDLLSKGGVSIFSVFVVLFVTLLLSLF
jgi:Protein of unknown function (DUF2628)